MGHIVGPDVEKHAVKMMAQLHHMKQENDHCDFIVQVGDDVYYTHKNVLSAGSDYFKAMLKHDTKESREGKVIFKDVDFECVKNCIDFIYCGKLEIADEMMKDLLHVAIMLQLEDVKQAISNILEESVTVKNYFSTITIADIYGLDAVSTRCRVFCHENIMEISKQPEFGNVGTNDILNIVRSEKSTLCEEEKITLLLKWVEINPKNEQHLRACFEAIKFDKIWPAFLEHLLETKPIRNDFGLYKLINGHLLKTAKSMKKMKYDIGNDKSLILFNGYKDCIQSFDPVTEKGDKFHDEKFKHLRNFSTIYLDSYIYVLCGNKSVHRLNFISKNSKWEKMNDMICQHGWFPRTVSLSRSLFVIGGSSYKVTSDVETFTPSYNQWFQLRNKPTSICDASLVSLNDSIYCIGGRGQGHVSLSSFCRFTPASSEWVELQPMRYPVYCSGVVAIDQNIYVIGGSGEIEAITNVECYNITSAQWNSLSSMNRRDGWISAHHIDKWIFAVPDQQECRVIEKYDISNDQWTTVEPRVEQGLEIYTSTLVKI